MAANKPFSEERREKLRQSRLGSKNPFYGRHHTDETKEKLRQISTGKKWSEESRRKLGLTIAANSRM